VAIEYIQELAVIDGKDVTNLDEPHRHFSYGVMQRMRELESAGHSFGLVEVPDYCAEGYFIAKARRFGLLRYDGLAVRLHSPVLMLEEDNASQSLANPSTYRFYDEERYVYRHADYVLYGGDAMLERIAALVPHEDRASFREKAIKAPHPWPPMAITGAAEKGPGGPVDIGYLGRLEYRKGVDLLVSAALAAMKRTHRQARFHFFGADTDTYYGGSMRALLDQLIPPAARDAFIFHGYTEQQKLRDEELPRMDMFVFPSRFENYPNVLLEVLAFGRPVLISKHGCMAELAEGFRQVSVIDPSDVGAFSGALLERIEQAPVRADARAIFDRRAQAAQQAIAEIYPALSERKRAIPARKTSPLRITVVVAHYNQSALLPALLDSAAGQIRKGDRLIVVDDCSSKSHAEAARAAVTERGFEFLSTPVNSGPSVARNQGVEATDTDLVLIADSDDRLADGALATFRGAFETVPELEVAGCFFQQFGDADECWAAFEPSPRTILISNSTGISIALRREVFRRLGGYRSDMRIHWEDWELNMRLALTGARFEVIPVPLYIYRADARGRNSLSPGRMRESYDRALRGALAALDERRRQVVWPEISDVLISMLVSAGSSDGPAGRPMRYQLVDGLNTWLKSTSLHRPMKRMLSTSLARVRSRKTGSRP
jgi:glycosyltransferase involved in cell wall biosynthesis